jgi:hypothetical protein
MRKLIASLALLGCSAAHADVVYQWQTLDDRGSVSILRGELRVTDAAAASGGAGVYFRPRICTYNRSACAPGELPGDPSSSFISLLLWVQDTGPGLQVNVHEGFGFADGMQQVLDVALSGLGSVIGSGFISSGGSQAVLQMSGDGGVWSIDYMQSDQSREDFRDCWADVCPRLDGPTTGQWVLASRVPLPSTLPLVLLGLAGAGAAVRRRSRG